MLEPEIREIRPPTAEPILRVGLVLEEDQLREIKIRLSDPGNLIDGFGSTQICGARELEFVLRGSQIFCKNFDKESERVFISRDKSIRTAPGKGIGVSPVKAGRGFHWSKEIQATYAGGIEILPGANGLVVVNHVELEDYLASVISSEMSAACPNEFAKAQAIAARSWVLVFLGHKHEGLPFTICNDDCCQRYQGTTFMSLSTQQAIQDCRGQTLVSRSGLVCPAYYSKSCGGRTDTIKEILNLAGGELVSIFDGPGGYGSLTDQREFSQFLLDPPMCFCSEATVARGQLSTYLGKVDEDGSYFRWKFDISKAEVVAALNREKFGQSIKEIEQISWGSRGKSGRILSAELRVRLTDGSARDILLKNQFEIRQVLQPSFLYSSAFIVESETRYGLSIFGAGWGHGVGLCQIGGLGMALRGESAAAILSHYYPNYQLAQSY